MMTMKSLAVLVLLAVGCGDNYEVTLVMPVGATVSSSGVGGAGGQDDTTPSTGGAGGQGGDPSTSATSVGHGGGVPIGVGVGATSAASSSHAASSAASSSTGPAVCDWMVCQDECQAYCTPEYKAGTGNCMNDPSCGFDCKVCGCLCVGQN